MSDVKDNVNHIIHTLENGFDGWGTENEDGEYQDAFAYLQDVLEINWILHSDRSLKGARLLVSFGGPNIWIDTTKGTVEGYWWSDKYIGEYDTSSEFSRELDEALETLFNC